MRTSVSSPRTEVTQKQSNTTHHVVSTKETTSSKSDSVVSKERVRSCRSNQVSDNANEIDVFSVCSSKHSRSRYQSKKRAADLGERKGAFVVARRLKRKLNERHGENVCLENLEANSSSDETMYDSNDGRDPRNRRACSKNVTDENALLSWNELHDCLVETGTEHPRSTASATPWDTALSHVETNPNFNVSSFEGNTPSGDVLLLSEEHVDNEMYSMTSNMDFVSQKGKSSRNAQISKNGEAKLVDEWLLSSPKVSQQLLSHKLLKRSSQTTASLSSGIDGEESLKIGSIPSLEDFCDEVVDVEKSNGSSAVNIVDDECFEVPSDYMLLL